MRARDENMVVRGRDFHSLALLVDKNHHDPWMAGQATMEMARQMQIRARERFRRNSHVGPPKPVEQLTLFLVPVIFRIRKCLGAGPSEEIYPSTLGPERLATEVKILLLVYT